MKRSILFLLISVFSLTSFAQNKPAYSIFNADGKKVSYKKMLKTLDASQIILFGEHHNNAIAHWLQLEVTKDLHKTNELVLGAEMFEADNQDELNQYLSGEINAKAFDTLARLWPNHDTDYAPLVNFAKNNKLPFIATNIPRRYASMVYKKGFEVLDSLTNEEKFWMAPLPMKFDSTLATYQDILKMMGEHGTPNLVKSQATKDATMAYFVLKSYTENSTFIHYNGAFHSDYFEGILWYLKQKQPNYNYTTISTVSQADLNQLDEEHKGKANFIIVVDEDMTTTY